MFGINSHQRCFVRRLKEEVPSHPPLPFLPPRNNPTMSDANTATILPQCVLLVRIYIDAPLTFAMQRSRLWCRGRDWSFLLGVHDRPDKDASELAPPSNQIGLDVDYDRINRNAILSSHQRTPKVRLIVEAPRRPSNSLARVQLSFPFHQERSHGFWNCLGVDVGRYPSPILIVSNLDFQMGGDIPPV